MKCKKCDGKGFIESSHAAGNSFTPSILQCCDISAYSKEVQRRLAQPFTPRPVIMAVEAPRPKPRPKLVLIKNEAK